MGSVRVVWCITSFIRYEEGRAPSNALSFNGCVMVAVVVVAVHLVGCDESSGRRDV